MARELTPCTRSDLLQLEDRLLDEGFQYLLTILPRQLFQLHHQQLVIDEAFVKLSSGDENPVFAYLFSSGKVEVDVGALCEYQFPSSVSRTPGDPRVQLISIQDKEITAFNQIPPLSWHSPPDHEYGDSIERRSHTIALIKYFLLRWASDNKCELPLPQPDYGHLVAALSRLKSTAHYKSKEVIFEDSARRDVHMSFRPDEDFRIGDRFHQANTKKSPETKDMEDRNSESRHSAGVKRRRLTSSEKAGSNEEQVNDPRLPTPHQSPKDTAMDIDIIDSAETTTRETSVASAAEFGSLPGVELENDLATALETSALARRSLPTPDTLMEESVVLETDPTLNKIRKEMGETLSLLPDLDMCTFKKVHIDLPQFLSLRLLLGTMQDPARRQLDGSEIWASFKIHDKGARAAPRMNIHAFHANTDDVIEDDLKIKEILPDLRLGPAFKGISGGERPEELQLKALVKYYFIIAARSNLLGFDEHHMPYNSSFVDQLKTVCKRLQRHGSSGDDQGVDTRPAKRPKRFHDRTPTTTSDVDDETALTARTRNARRGGRRTEPSSAAVSESEDNVFVPIVSAPPPLPRRLALGAPILAKKRNIHQAYGPEDISNEFLDLDIDARDSDGDSGDEIPGPISNDFCASLQKRSSFYYSLKQHRDIVKGKQKYLEGMDMGSRKVKGKLKNVTDPDERSTLERDLAHRGVRMNVVRTHLGIQDHILDGWKAKKKEMDAAAGYVDPKTIEVWKALYRHRDY